jgi:WD40 repeat protein
VDSIFSNHCLDCHASQDPEGDLVLDNFENFSKGGKSGAAFLSGKSEESLVVKMIEGRFVLNGSRKIMPPGKRPKLTAEEIQAIRKWIDDGAIALKTALARKEPAAPKIVPRVNPRNPVLALAIEPQGKRVASARFGRVEIRRLPGFELERGLACPNGNVNAVVWSADGQTLFSGGGQPSVSGQIRVWGANDGKMLREIIGHKDAIYSMALSPDGKVLATGSYDQKIKLWDVALAKEIRTLSGHNGCVYGLCFRPDGKLLASASADRTVKLWDVATGERRDTFAQSLKDLFTVAFSPDGIYLVAGGSDNRIRMWQITPDAKENTNPLKYSKFAHEGAILRLAFTADGKELVSAADDRTVKCWDAVSLQERFLLEPQTDWPCGLAMNGSQEIVVGRLDGSLGRYEISDGKPLGGLLAGSEENDSTIAKVAAKQ